MIVWIFQTGEPLPSDGNNERPMRTINLTSALVKEGHSVVIWSSSFFHQKKIHRSKFFKRIIINKFITVNLIPSIGYQSNISLRRLIDHAFLAINLKKELDKNKDVLPNVAFIGYPPVEFAFVAGMWLRKHSIPYVVDVKDQWPHIFVRQFPSKIRNFVKLFFLPYYFMAKKVLSLSTSISSISEPFLNWSLNVANRKKSEKDFIFYLSPPNKKIFTKDKLIIKKQKTKFNKLNIVAKNKNKNFLFVGNFMKTAFDFNPLIEAANYSTRNNLDWKFILCGNGDSWQELREKTKNIKNIILVGRVNYMELILISKLCSLGIAPIKNNPDYLISIPNKVLDYIALGLPVITSLSGIARSLIMEKNVGLYFNKDEKYALVKSILIYQNNPEKVLEQSINCKKLFKNKFEHKKIYKEALEIIGSISLKP